jgi:hypothetical protein
MSEKTHAKNLDNLDIRIAIAESMGSLYNTSNEMIKLDNLRAFRDSCRAVSDAYSAALPVKQNRIDERQAAFKAVSARLGLFVKAAVGQGLGEDVIERLRASVADYRGVRIGAKTPDDPLTPDVDESKANNSVSNRSFAGLLEKHQFFGEQLKTDAIYKPTEELFKIETYDAWHDELQGINTAAINARILADTSRAALLQMMYNAVDGLLPRMKQQLGYLETLLAATDPRLKQAKSLKFVEPRILQ